MSRHVATIEWHREGDFAAGRYSRRHSWRFDGGLEVAGSASPQVVPPPASDPAAVDPEEALVASAASCHMLWFLDLARQAGHVVESYADDAEGTLGRRDDGRIAITRIVLRPRVAFADDLPSDEAIARLHEEAHARCFIANSLNSEMLVEPVAVDA
ncbi:MAG: OsmC family protein [Sphingosinicella sp.]